MACEPKTDPVFTRNVRCRSNRSISIGENAVRAFRRCWPASGFPAKPLWAAFGRNGDLEDISNGAWEHADGHAVSAMLDDAKEVCLQRAGKGWR